MLGQKFDWIQTSANMLAHVGTACNIAQQSVQTVQTCWAQQCWVEFYIRNYRATYQSPQNIHNYLID